MPNFIYIKKNNLCMKDVKNIQSDPAKSAILTCVKSKYDSGKGIAPHQ